MDYNKIKKVVRVLLILAGAVVLISELMSATKNYYAQSIGIVLLMTGLFLVNTTVKSKTENTPEEYSEEEEE